VLILFFNCLLVTDFYNNRSTYNNSSCGMIELLYYNRHVLYLEAGMPDMDLWNKINSTEWI
jgi:hypothetical protein